MLDAALEQRGVDVLERERERRLERDDKVRRWMPAWPVRDVADERWGCIR